MATAPSSAAESSATEVNSSVAAAAPLNSSEATHPRLSNTTACLPIVYGSVAFYLGDKADEYKTHNWTLYLRGPNNEDLSLCIAKVIFQLHPSFSQPIRELTTPPFEVTEYGWGEFEAQIRIIWKDSSEKATLLTHGIKLYPPGATNATQPTMEPVVAETYDEVVFTDPNEAFYRQLMRISIVPPIPSGNANLAKCLPKYSDNDDFQVLVEAQRFLEKELSGVKERMKLCSDEMNQVDVALREAQEAKKTLSRKTKATSSPVGSNPSKKQKPNV